MDLNRQNYYSIKANEEYLSASQIKEFNRCEFGAWTDLNNPSEPTPAMLVSSYVDAWLDQTQMQFVAENADKVLKKDGTLRAEFLKGEETIRLMENHPEFMEYLLGEKQTILTGEIAGEKFKCRLDVLNHEKKRIVDLKYMRDVEPVWDGGFRRSFIDFWQYDIQLAIYREIVRQNFGEEYDCYLAVCTKESNPDLEIIKIDGDLLDRCLQSVEYVAPRYAAIKNGSIFADNVRRCGKCKRCRELKKVKPLIYYGGECDIEFWGELE